MRGDLSYLRRREWNFGMWDVTHKSKIWKTKVDLSGFWGDQGETWFGGFGGFGLPRGCQLRVESTHLYAAELPRMKIVKTHLLCNKAPLKAWAGDLRRW